VFVGAPLGHVRTLEDLFGGERDQPAGLRGEQNPVARRPLPVQIDGDVCAVQLASERNERLRVDDAGNLPDDQSEGFQDGWGGEDALERGQ